MASTCRQSAFILGAALVITVLCLLVFGPNHIVIVGLAAGWTVFLFWRLMLGHVFHKRELFSSSENTEMSLPYLLLHAAREDIFLQEGAPYRFHVGPGFLLWMAVLGTGFVISLYFGHMQLAGLLTLITVSCAVMITHVNHEVRLRNMAMLAALVIGGAGIHGVFLQTASASASAFVNQEISDLNLLIAFAIVLIALPVLSQLKAMLFRRERIGMLMIGGFLWTLTGLWMAHSPEQILAVMISGIWLVFTLWLIALHRRRPIYRLYTV